MTEDRAAKFEQALNLLHDLALSAPTPRAVGALRRLCGTFDDCRKTELVESGDEDATNVVLIGPMGRVQK